MKGFNFGFRILGPTTGERRLVDAFDVFAGYANCDERAEVNREAYLSEFTFGAEFRELLETRNSVKGFTGPCWAPLVWWDIDREDNLDAALADTRRLTGAVIDRFRLDDDGLLAFVSGGKGFHVGISTSLWDPAPSVEFHRVARQFAESLAERACVRIDTGVYDKVRPFRAPNSRHAKTGRYKRRLNLDELFGLSLDGIMRLAESPEAFDLPAPIGACAQASSDWHDAEEWVRRQADMKARRQADGIVPTLNRLTFDYIRNGAGEGDRHRLLFSAAANLAEFGCPTALAHELLTEAGLDCGLPPSDVRRQIECGLAHGAGKTIFGSSPPEPATVDLVSSTLQTQLAVAWQQRITDNEPTLQPILRPERCEQPLVARSRPPSGAQLYFQDERCRPCPPAEATTWTWAGGPRWFSVAEVPIPPIGEGDA